jgi:hypothetical protein
MTAWARAGVNRGRPAFWCSTTGARRRALDGDVFTVEDTLLLSEVGVEIPVNEIYEAVDFSDPASE